MIDMGSALHRCRQMVDDAARRSWSFGPPSDTTDTHHSGQAWSWFDPSQFGLSLAWESTADDRNVQVLLGPVSVYAWCQPSAWAVRAGRQYRPPPALQRTLARGGVLTTWTAYWDWRHVGASVRVGRTPALASAHIRVGAVGAVWERDSDPGPIRLAAAGT